MYDRSLACAYKNLFCGSQLQQTRGQKGHQSGSSDCKLLAVVWTIGLRISLIVCMKNPETGKCGDAGVERRSSPSPWHMMKSYQLIVCCTAPLEIDCIVTFWPWPLIGMFLTSDRNVHASTVYSPEITELHGFVTESPNIEKARILKIVPLSFVINHLQ